SYYLGFHSFPTRRSSDLLQPARSSPAPVESKLKRVVSWRPQNRSLRDFSRASTSLSTLIWISCSILTFILMVIGSFGAATSMREIGRAHVELQSRENLVC